MSAVAPYGSWRSPISAEMAAGSAVRFQEVCVAGGAVVLGGDASESGARALRVDAP